MNRIPCNFKTAPRGATIIEVMFAIGVLLFGLVGIAAVIPAAGQLARSSIDYTRGVSVATNAAATVKSHRITDISQWRIINDLNSTAQVIAAPVVLTNPASFFVCIDPLFVCRPENLRTPAQGDSGGLELPGRYVQFSSSGGNGFRRNRFPYFVEDYNPLADPATGTSRNWSTANVPRMARLSMNGAFGGMLSGKAAEKIFDDTDQLSFFQPSDKTLVPGQVFRNTASPGTFVPGSRAISPTYSWFVTMQSLGSSLGVANAVIVKGRDRLFETPAPGQTPPKKLAERLGFANPVSGDFRGGAGGRIQLVLSSAIDASVRNGSWIMLMRNGLSVGTGPQHAWYRIVQTETTAALTSFDDPIAGGSHSVWVQNLVLSGPDWKFAPAIPSLTTPTLAVLVEGVVSVVEFPVQFQ